jgi:predicted ferric reductase
MRKLLLVIISVVGLLSFTIVSARITSAVDENGSIVVQTIPGPTVAEKLASRAEASWPWYLTRASGIIAALTLVILMLSGIGQVTGYTFHFLDPLTSWASHRALGIAFSVSVLVHMFSLLFDHFIKFNIVDILVPWSSSYRPVTIFGMQLGSLYVALGVLSFYLVAFVTISSLVWVEKKPYIWKWLHLLTYITIFFVFIHALYLGTDLTHGIVRLIWIILGAGVVLATLQRLWRVKTT